MGDKQEIVRYLFFGGLTTIVSIFSFYIFAEIMYLHELYSNILSWLISVTFAFVTNKKYVFHSKGAIKEECISFFSGRVETLILESVIIFVFVTIMKYPSMIVKIIATVIVIIANYFVSKLMVFKD